MIARRRQQVDQGQQNTASASLNISYCSSSTGSSSSADNKYQSANGKYKLYLQTQQSTIMTSVVR